MSPWDAPETDDPDCDECAGENVFRMVILDVQCPQDALCTDMGCTRCAPLLPVNCPSCGKAPEGIAES